MPLVIVTDESQLLLSSVSFTIIKIVNVERREEGKKANVGKFIVNEKKESTAALFIFL